MSDPYCEGHGCDKFNEPRRQPKTITLELRGEHEDLQNQWHELYRFLNGKFANVDFDWRKEKITFYCHPWAIND